MGLKFPHRKIEMEDFSNESMSESEEELQFEGNEIITGPPLSIKNKSTLKWEVFNFTLDVKKRELIAKVRN